MPSQYPNEEQESENLFVSQNVEEESPQEESSAGEAPSQQVHISEEELSDEEYAQLPSFDEDAGVQEEGELAVDVYQTEQEIVVQAPIAGVRAEDLDISVEEDLVTITGARKNPNQDTGQRYYFRECFWGPFSREIILPEEVDGSDVQATLKEGVLTLRMPRIQQDRIKKVEVKKEK